jgi:hypothetical protein
VRLDVPAAEGAYETAHPDVPTVLVGASVQVPPLDKLPAADELTVTVPVGVVAPLAAVSVTVVVHVVAVPTSTDGGEQSRLLDDGSTVGV